MNSISPIGIEKNTYYQNKLQASFVEQIDSIKEKSSSNSNALASSSVVSVEISALGAEELEKVRQSWNNHPVSALYRTDIPISANGDGVYKIGKVDFSEEEFVSARNLITGMTSLLKQGTLSYNDHAKMALAESLIDKCAAASFSEDQRQVIVKAMKDYNDRLVDRNNELITKPGCIKNDDESAGEYWGLRQIIPEAAKGAMEKLFGMRPASTSAVTSIATNQELIEKLQEKIKKTDLTEKKGMDEFSVFYRLVMKPAYDAQYPDKMRSDSQSTVELDLNGPNGMMKLLDFATKWLEQNS